VGRWRGGASGGQSGGEVGFSVSGAGWSHPPPPPTNPSLLLSGSGRVLVSSCQQQRVWSGMEEATWVAAWKAVWFRQPLPLPLLLSGVSSESTTTISRNGEAVVSATVSGGARAQRTSL
jgi:hypothetical protein